jgi:hypothetical protein
MHKRAHLHVNMCTHARAHTHAHTHTHKHVFLYHVCLSLKKDSQMPGMERDAERSEQCSVSLKASLDVAAYSPITSCVLSILCRSVISNWRPTSLSGHTAFYLIRTLAHLAKFSKRYYSFSFRRNILFWKSYGARRHKNTEC